jgi:Ca2+-binding RTX toxin-like protein
LPNGVGGEEGSDSITGGRQNDSLEGGPGNDTLRGLEGADTIAGQDGTDVLHGGPGADLFIINKARISDADAVDVIADFEKGQDKIMLEEEVGFADLVFVAQGNDVLTKTLAGNNLVLLIGITPAELTADDFLFPIIG